MPFLILFLVSTVGSIWWMKKSRHPELGPVLCLAFSAMLLLTVLLAAALHQISGVEAALQHEELTEVVSERPTGADMEDVYGQVALLNSKLKTSKFWNEMVWFDLFIYDGWADLEPIRIPERGSP